MMSLDEMELLLEEILEEYPEELFRELNGGILLLPDEKRNPNPTLQELYILGEYHHGGPMGRYIALYYGSFQRVFGRGSHLRIRKELDHTLKHEFTHHLESLAGERSLELEDQLRIQKYLKDRSLEP